MQLLIHGTTGLKYITVYINFSTIKTGIRENMSRNSDSFLLYCANFQIYQKKNNKKWQHQLS